MRRSAPTKSAWRSPCLKGATSPARTSRAMRCSPSARWHAISSGATRTIISRSKATNQPTLERDIALLFETRRIGRSTALNATLDFLHVGQVFLIERESIDKKTGVHRRDIALGITSRTPQQALPPRVLAVNRGHWSIESVHYMIDWHYDEDRSRSRSRSRLRPGEHHSPASLRGRLPQVLPETRAIHRRDDARALLPHSPRVRLLAHDAKFKHRGLPSMRTNLPWSSVPALLLNSRRHARLV